MCKNENNHLKSFRKWSNGQRKLKLVREYKSRQMQFRQDPLSSRSKADVDRSASRQRCEKATNDVGSRQNSRSEVDGTDAGPAKTRVQIHQSIITTTRPR